MTLAKILGVGQSNAPLYLTGGPSRSPGIAARVAHFWRRPVQLLADSGAAYGAALAAFRGGE